MTAGNANWLVQPHRGITAKQLRKQMFRRKWLKVVTDRLFISKIETVFERGDVDSRGWI